MVETIVLCCVLFWFGKKSTPFWGGLSEPVFVFWLFHVGQVGYSNCTICLIIVWLFCRISLLLDLKSKSPYETPCFVVGGGD